ncbi:hypothetical protein LRK24_16515 [Rhodanobacter denitrificans]|uniref:hypothetical protein n=1 Tax=Rhodanobacter denitrificans TaxID=666685 RepID=UPI001F3F7E79|nr:hypothetical protein [Rhodanobacter denitrificans]UJM90016.1 hypothetical protein LRK24_16515 [Rhodanobacter denitrificans]
MTARVGHDQVLVRLNDQEPRTHGEQGEDGDDGNDQGPDGPTRMPTRIKYVSGIHGLSLSVDRYPRFFPLSIQERRIPRIHRGADVQKVTPMAKHGKSCARSRYRPEICSRQASSRPSENGTLGVGGERQRGHAAGCAHGYSTP